jgi:hypothetical protein
LHQTCHTISSAATGPAGYLRTYTPFSLASPRAAWMRQPTVRTASPRSHPSWRSRGLVHPRQHRTSAGDQGPIPSGGRTQRRAGPPSHQLQGPSPELHGPLLQLRSRLGSRSPSRGDPEPTLCCIIAA